MSKYPPAGIWIHDLLPVLWNLYQVVMDEHSGQHFEGECPTCHAVRDVQKLLPSANQLPKE